MQVFKITTVWRGRLCSNTGHFPRGYLAMGKNVFSQINDMFIQKEVATLFRSSAASKFQRKKLNKATQIEDGPHLCLLFAKDRSTQAAQVAPCERALEVRNVSRMWKRALNGPWKPNSVTPWDRPLSKQSGTVKSTAVSVHVRAAGSPPILQHHTPTSSLAWLHSALGVHIFLR